MTNTIKTSQFPIVNVMTIEDRIVVLANASGNAVSSTITLDHMATAVANTTQIHAVVDAANVSAQAAAASANSAANSANSATTSAASALASRNAANTSANNAATSAAAALVSQNAANTSANNAAVSTTNANTSAAAALASQTAANTSANNAATSAAAALVSQNAANTSANNAAASAAAALVSQNAANTSANNAANSAAAALVSQNAANTSANNAATSATAANVAKITWRAAYSAATAYVVRDAVSFNGSSWIAKTSTTGNSPPTLPAVTNTWWDLLAQKGDVYEEYAVSIQKAANIDLGTYYAERSSSANCTLTKFYAEVITGDVSSRVDVYLSANGTSIYGPVSAVLGTPVDVTGLALVVGAGSKISFVVTFMSGNVTEFFAKTYGATS